MDALSEATRLITMQVPEPLVAYLRWEIEKWDHERRRVPIATPTDSPRPARPAEHEELVEELLEAIGWLPHFGIRGEIVVQADRVQRVHAIARRLREARGGTDG